jgi:hypothetical protein
MQRISRKQLNKVRTDLPLREYENFKYKVTIEELNPFKFITTIWYKEQDLEVDRRVFEFETFGGAMDKGFELLTKILDKAV